MAIEPERSACDTVYMKNITVSLDDETYRRARVRAAELDTSVSAVVREYLMEFAGGQTDFERRRKLQERTLGSIRAFRAGGRLSREAVHDRDALR
jgi:hypothetical protein